MIINDNYIINNLMEHLRDYELNLLRKEILILMNDIKNEYLDNNNKHGTVDIINILKINKYKYLSLLSFHSLHSLKIIFA